MKSNTLNFAIQETKWSESISQLNEEKRIFKKSQMIHSLYIYKKYMMSLLYNTSSAYRFFDLISKS